MNPQQLLTILAARRRLAIGVWMACLLAGAAVAMFWPKQYTASAVVMLDLQVPEPGSAAAVAALQPGYIATQVDLIGSERVMRRALRQLGWQQDAALQALWRDHTDGIGDFEAWLAQRLMKKLDVEPSRESNVIRIVFVADEREKAAAMANALVQAYAETALEMRIEPARAHTRYYDERSQLLRQQLEAAQARLAGFQQSRGLLPSDDRIDVENARVIELQTQLVAAEALAAESGGRRAQAGARPEQMTEVLADPVVGTLQTDLVREQQKLQDLAGRLGESHPQLVQQRLTVQELEARVKAAVRRASGSIGTTAAANRERVAVLNAQLQAQRERVLKMKSARDEEAVLQREVQHAQRAYDDLQQRTSQTSLASHNTLSNVGVIQQASVPPTASFPKTVPTLAAAALVGVLLAVIAALVREIFDRRLRGREDVVVELGLPLLVTLPRGRHQGGEPPLPRVELLKGRVLAGLPHDPLAGRSLP